MRENTLPLKNDDGKISGIVGGKRLQRLRCDHISEQDVRERRGVAFAVQNTKGTKTYVMAHTCGLNSPCSRAFLSEMAKAIYPDFDKIRVVYLKSGSWTLIPNYNPESMR